MINMDNNKRVEMMDSNDRPHDGSLIFALPATRQRRIRRLLLYAGRKASLPTTSTTCPPLIDDLVLPPPACTNGILPNKESRRISKNWTGEDRGNERGNMKLPQGEEVEEPAEIPPYLHGGKGAAPFPPPTSPPPPPLLLLLLLLPPHRSIENYWLAATIKR